jgi:HNH endonuclease
MVCELYDIDLEVADVAEWCIFCPNELTKDTKPEHILLNALGGCKTTTRVDCSACNNLFGSTIDREAAQQVKILRNMLQLDSGAGRAPPMLRNIPSGNDVINLMNDGTPELVAKPFAVRRLDDGSFELEVKTKSVEDLAPYVPHIAAQLHCSEEQVLEILRSTTGSNIERRPDVVHHALGLGGPLAVRSAAKSALVLWATLTGNVEIKSSPYDDVRRFIVEGSEAFNLARAHLDSRYLPHSGELQNRFGEFFNLIYVRSDESGRVVAHFTLYNIISWQIILAEAGGTPNARIGLISNPLDPTKWSDTIADEIDIDFVWLNTPDYGDEFVRARERFEAAMRHHVATQRDRELNRIATAVFEKHGIVDENQPITDLQLRNKIAAEISRRFALHALGLPYVETLTGEEIVARLKAVRDAGTLG